MSESLCEFLEWDSSFFGVSIGRVTRGRLAAGDMPRVLDWCREHDIQCLYFLCAPDDDEGVLQAERNGFHLVDIRVELQWKPDGESGPIYEGEVNVRPYSDEDKDELLEIAKVAFHHSRFYNDYNFPREKATALYREWLMKSCNGFANMVYVALEDNQVKGFITSHIDSPQQGRIGLVGIKRGRYGQGIGQSLVKSAQSYFVKQNVKEALVVTQGRNIAAQRLYQKCGFITHSLNLWYHKWFRDFSE